MNPFRNAVFFGALVLASAAGAQAPERVRGSITAVASR